jgi:hypothetical protein
MYPASAEAATTAGLARLDVSFRSRSTDGLVPLKLADAVNLYRGEGLELLQGTGHRRVANNGGRRRGVAKAPRRSVKVA